MIKLFKLAVLSAFAILGFCQPEPYDEALALEGLTWLNDLRALVAQNGAAPEPTERLSFCAAYCDYYDPTGEVGCPSMSR